MSVAVEIIAVGNGGLVAGQGLRWENGKRESYYTLRECKFHYLFCEVD